MHLPSRLSCPVVRRKQGSRTGRPCGQGFPMLHVQPRKVCWGWQPGPGRCPGEHRIPGHLIRTSHRARPGSHTDREGSELHGVTPPEAEPGRDEAVLASSRGSVCVALLLLALEAQSMHTVHLCTQSRFPGWQP